MAVTLALQATPTLASQMKTGQNNSAESIVNKNRSPFQLGPFTFWLPQDALKYAPRSGSKDAGNLSLSLLLPGLDLAAEHNHTEFEKPGWNNKVLALLEFPARTAPPHLVLYGPYGLFVEGIKPQRLREGVHELPSEVSGFRKFDRGFGGVTYISDQDGEFFVSCFLVDRPRISSIQVYPSCSRIERLWNVIDLQYSYSFSYLSDAASIDERIKDLLTALLSPR